MKKIVFILGMFVFEYLGNHIINSIPSSYFRYIFYRYVLRIKCDSSVYFLMNIYIYIFMLRLIGNRAEYNYK